MTFKMLTGRTVPHVGRDEAVFYENMSVTDGKGQLYFRRHGRVYVIEATTAFVPTQPPGGTNNFRLLDDEYLHWSPTLATPVPEQRSAGIRWHVTGVTPDRFEFDVGNGTANQNTRMYMQKFITGNDASLNNSPFEFVLNDTTTYTSNPSTSTYRGLSTSGTTTIGVGGTGGSSISNLLHNADFELWSSATQATDWQTPNAPVSNPSRTTSPVHGGSFSCGLLPVDATQGGAVVSTGSGSPYTHYITQASNGQACRLRFWLYGNGSAADRKCYWYIAAYNTSTQTSASYALQMAAGVITGWGVGDPLLSVTPNTVIAQDNAWHQYTYDFNFNPGTPAATYYVAVWFAHGGTNNSGTNGIYIDDIEFGPATGSTITAPLTVRGFTLDQWSVKPYTLAAGDTLSMTAVAGAWLVPTLKPTLSDATATVTLTDAYGARSGITLDNSGNSGTFTVTNAYSHYFEDPGVGTTKYAGYFAGNIGLASNKLLKIFGTSTGFTSIVGGAQGSTNIAWTLPTAQGAADTLLKNNGSGALSWDSLSSLGIVTGTGTLNQITKWLNTTGGLTDSSLSDSGVGGAITSTVPIIPSTDNNVSLTLGNPSRRWSVVNTPIIASGASTLKLQTDDNLAAPADRFSITSGAATATASFASTISSVFFNGAAANMGGGLVNHTAAVLPDVDNTSPLGSQTLRYATVNAPNMDSFGTSLTLSTKNTGAASSPRLTITSGVTNATATWNNVSTLFPRADAGTDLGDATHRFGFLYGLGIASEATDMTFYTNNNAATETLRATLSQGSATATWTFAATNLAMGGGTITGLGSPLSVANGGTGLATFTSNVIYKGNGTSALAASTITDDGTNIDLSSGSIRSTVASSASALTFSTKNNSGTQTNRILIQSGQTNANTSIAITNVGTVSMGNAQLSGVSTFNPATSGVGSIGALATSWGNIYATNIVGGDDFNGTDFTLQTTDGGGTPVTVLTIPLTADPQTCTWRPNLTFIDARDIAFGTSTGTKIGTSTSQKLAFYNSSPIAQRSGAAQVAVATTASTNVGPFGYTTAAQADAIVTLVNELRAALVALGLIKGSA